MARIINETPPRGDVAGLDDEVSILSGNDVHQIAQPAHSTQQNRALSTTRRGDERPRPCRENRADHPTARLRS
jgi:hypothetical protein